MDPVTSNEKKPVVIVGAGPCGLAAACELLQLGVPVRVLEKESEPGAGTRAIQLWPPALEVLDRVGVLADARRRGVRIKANEYHLAGGRRLRIMLGDENEPLILPQEQTTQLLEEALERLGGRVERSMRVVAVESGPGSVSVKAHGPDGVELIEADWLIGADGVHSVVREQLGIEFAGERVPMTLMVAEGRVAGRYDRASAHFFLGRTGSAVFVPMPGDTVRIAGAIPPDVSLTSKTVQEILDERGPGALRVEELDLVTTFGSSERIAATFREGRCFLVGDAAHTHVPLGSQGLSLGLQDVHNLAWKLAGVIDGRLDPRVLDTYDAERRQAAGQIVRMIHQGAAILTVGPLAARVRNVVCDALQATGTLRRRLIPRLAGWRTSYPNVLLGPDPIGARGPRRRVSRRRMPQPGSRIPHDVPAQRSAVTGGLQLLTTGAPTTPLAARARETARRRPSVLTHEHRPSGRTGFMLLRPDGYVAATGRTTAELDRLERVLEARLIPGGGESHAV
ncbi:FAD-dependent oxidoreductase [Streptomyces sp. NBC_01451]|uniref:FAD-dependent oxidoreductase n=1 Tax=Streptomyces sp. NBC_01451 TaxID=2903872 RepID=UPI002E2FCEE3|nr:FAD-dependent monooxygenase [Streptomyces sp. NBC_01451]